MQSISALDIFRLETVIISGWSGGLHGYQDMTLNLRSNTVKYPESVWGAFSGNNGSWGSFFLQEHYLDWSQLFGGSGAAKSPHPGHPSVPTLHA